MLIVLLQACENFLRVSVDNTVLFSNLIARTSQDIDILIDSLPSQDYTQDRQDSTLRKLEAENRLAAETLKKTVEASGEHKTFLCFIV